jgi:tetratricopeptide (TPR) repeat protein
MYLLFHALGNTNSKGRRIMLSRIIACLFLCVLLSIGAHQPIAQVQQDDPDIQTAEGWITSGYLQGITGKDREALRFYRAAANLYQRAIKNKPTNALLWKNLGFAYWLCNNRKEALVAYKEAVRLKPDDPESHSMLGFLQSSNLDVAIGEYREAVRLKPAEASYHIELGVALAKKKDIHAAIAEAEEAIRLDPRNGAYHALLGGILLEEGDINKAASEFLKAGALRKPVGVSASYIDLLAKEKKASDAEDLDYWIHKAEAWKTSVARHKPGDLDAAAVNIGSWPMSDLEAILGAVVELTGRKMPRKYRLPIALKNCYPEFKNAVKGKLKLTNDPNSILKRGALLHTDIAILGLETGKVDAPDSEISLVHDGLGITTSGGQHWELARLLLNSLSPNPSKDEMARRWYIATTAHMLSRRERIYADQNLKRALEVIPLDAKLLFYAGALHESYASPKSQTAIPPPGFHYQFGAKKSELELALKFLTQSVESDAKFDEAHLRLGRVMGLLGDHKEAIAELQKADATVTNPKLKYYAALFLGYELAALGRNAKARECFDRASTLFPAAQSPLLAASHLARSSGDFSTALQYIQKVFSLPLDSAQANDPWWEYERECVRDSESLIAGMRKEFGELPP